MQYICIFYCKTSVGNIYYKLVFNNDSQTIFSNVVLIKLFIFLMVKNMKKVLGEREKNSSKKKILICMFIFLFFYIAFKCLL